MCTLAFYFQQFQALPLIVAANRDEFFSRPSAPPQVLVEKPLVFGGKDLLAGGTWLGVNEQGLLAGILNRRANPEQTPGTRRSRGLLCLDILQAKNPAEARLFLGKEKGLAYQPFNLLFANADEAWVAYNSEDRIPCVKLERGVHVLSNSAIFDLRSEKLDQAYHLFSEAGERVRRDLEVSQPSLIRLLKGILSNHALREGSKDPKDAICVHSGAYGTVSSSVIFYGAEENRYSFYQTSGPPCRSDYEQFLCVEVL